MSNRDVNIDLRARDNASRAMQSASVRLVELRREIDALRGKGAINLTVADTKNIARLTSEAGRLERALAGIGTTGAQSAAALQGSLGGLGSVLGGLGINLPTLGAAGLVAAGVGAAKATVALGNLGAQSLVTEKSFSTVLASVGRGPEVLGALQAAASGTVSELRLMQLTNTALAGASAELGGTFADAAPKLLMAARAANQLNPSLGDTEFLFQSLITGIKRGSPMLIDNTGITLKIGEANEKYAASLGKSADALTEEEKKVALLQATMEGADRLIQQAGGSLDNLTTSAQQATTAWANLRAAVGEKLAPNVSAAQSSLAGLLNTLTNIVSGKQPEIELRYRVETDLERAKFQLREAEAGLAKAAQQGEYLSGTTDAWQREVDEARVAVVEANIAMQRLNGTLGQTGFDGWSDAGVQAARRVRDAALEASAAMMGPVRPEPVAAAAPAKAPSPYAFTGPDPKLVGQKIWNDALAKEAAAKAAAAAAAAEMNRANTGIANDYRSKMSSAVDKLSSYMQSEYSAAQQTSIGLADARPGGAGGVNAPGQNGAFEDIFRLQAWLSNGSWQETADKYAIASREQAQSIVASFQAGNITPDVAKLIDTEALVDQAKMQSAAEANYDAFAAAIAAKASSDTTTAQAVVDAAFGRAVIPTAVPTVEAGALDALDLNRELTLTATVEAGALDALDLNRELTLTATVEAGALDGAFSGDMIGDAGSAGATRQGQIAQLAAQTRSAFVAAMANQTGPGTDIMDALLGDMRTVGADGATAAQTAAQKTGASAAQALASAFQVEISGKDFAGQMIGYGETVWGYAEKGIIDKAKTSKAFGAAIKLMVENVLASELEG